MEVFHPCLQRRELAAVIGDPRAPLVEQDQPKRPRKAHIELAPQRVIPATGEIGNEVRHIYKIDLAITDHLVRERDAAIARIANLGTARPPSPTANRHCRILTNCGQ